MIKYQSLAAQITNNPACLQARYLLLLDELANSFENIQSVEIAQQPQSYLDVLVVCILKRQNGSVSAYLLLHGVIELLQCKNSQLLKVIYRWLPMLIRRFIEADEKHNKAIESCVRLIYNNSWQSYHQFLQRGRQISVSPFIQSLCKENLDYKILRTATEDLRFELNTEPKHIKGLLLFVVYQNVGLLRGKALEQYLRTIFVYCGGDETLHKDVSTIFLLQKRQGFSIFKHSINEQELEWIILSLYELALQSKQMHNQILATINLIYKKTANECLFRLSEIIQSAIHLLEDQYQEVFI